VESARLLGALVRLVKDLDRAEDLAQEALLAALETWPEAGIPQAPGAWLLTAARNRGLDQLRHGKLAERKEGELAQILYEPAVTSREEHLDEAAIGDDVLRLMLVACHPILSREARVALTLRLLGGLTTEEIARAFLLPEATLAQRVVRAKRTLKEARVPFELPRGPELAARVPPVLEVIYLIFNEGYAATSGERWLRTELCDEALRLGRVLAERLPREAEVHGLVALMELHASRSRARTTSDGRPVLLMDQDRAQWDQLLLRRGLAALERAQALAQPLGPYTLQAAISACHARARSAEETDFRRIVALYDALVELTGSPVVELNRAVAVGMAYGPEEALPLVEELGRDPALASYHLLPAVRGDLLCRANRLPEARAAFERAAELAQTAREREFLRARAQACANGRPSSRTN
jgi:RNA polymerase sigma factor (sigma-70 family)